MARALSLVILVFLMVATTVWSEEFKREGTGEKRQAKDALEGKPAPKLVTKDWLNTDGQPLQLEKYKGKVVLIDFWGVWCGPCRKAIPHLKELHAKHKDDGLIVIGVHTTNQGEKAAKFVEEQEISYPIGIDVEKKTVAAFQVDSYPDYYLIDKNGVLRFADLANKEVDRAVELLLAE